MASREELEKRYWQFRCVELPGQPLMMHMGTSYLVNDLHNALTAAEKERDRLKERIYQSTKILRELVENVGEWADQEVRDTVDGVIDGLESEVLRTGGRI